MNNIIEVNTDAVNNWAGNARHDGRLANMDLDGFQGAARSQFPDYDADELDDVCKEIWSVWESDFGPYDN